MNVWIAVVASGVLAAGLRVAFVAGNHAPLPRWFDRAASLVGPSFTAAVVAVWAFGSDGTPAVGPEAVALLVATPVALRSRSIPLTMASGVLVASVLRVVW